MLKFKINLIWILCFGICRLAFAGDISFEVTVDRKKVTLGEVLELNLAFYGTQNVAAPDIGRVEGFQARYVGPSTMISIVNGAVTASITHVYTLIPLKTGTFTLGPFSAEAEGKTLMSHSITIEVVSVSSSSPSYSRRQALEEPPAKVDAQELKDRIFLTLNVGKKNVYVNEVTPLTIKLYARSLGVRDIQFPALETNEFSVEKFGQPKQYREESGGVLYDVIEFTTDMFAIKPGEFMLGPARLKCSLLVRRQHQRRRNPSDEDFFGGIFGEDIFDGFFDRFEAHPIELKSEGVPVIVLPLPQEGRPEGFDGALGQFQLEVEAAPLEVRAGDPITLKMTVRGEGNFDSVKAPKLQSRDGFKVYDPQERREEAKLIFEQVLIPASEKVTHLPPVILSFFNIATGQYQSLISNPISIAIAPAQEEERPKIVEPPQVVLKASPPEELGRDIIYIKSSLGRVRKTGHFLYKSFGFWLAQFSVFVLFMGAVFFHRRRQKLLTDHGYARRLRAPLKAKSGMREIDRLLREGEAEAFFDAIFKTFREYLADRFHLPAGGITALTIEEMAKEKKISNETLEKMKRIFADCDMVRYAPAQLSPKQREDIFRSLREIIDDLEKRRI